MADLSKSRASTWREVKKRVLAEIEEYDNRQLTEDLSDDDSNDKNPPKRANVCDANLADPIVSRNLADNPAGKRSFRARI